MAYDYDLGVIGGGSAGLTVAAGAAQAGAKTLLVEREPVLGGDCLHFGCVPSKTLIRTAEVFHALKNAPAWGLPAVGPLPVDFSSVRDRIKAVIDVIQKHDSEERFCDLGVRVEFGPAEFVDERKVKVDGRPFTAKSWVIATGSSPAAPPLEGLDRTPYLTNKEIFYLDKLPTSMIVLGAGPIAVEMAQAFARLGTSVTMVQRSGQILSKEDRDMADAVMARLRGEGVRVMLDTTTVRAADAGTVREVVVRPKDGQETTLRAEALLVALGRRPNLDGLNLDQAGVEFDRKGLKLDHRLRTTQKHVFGAGDVTGTFQFTHAAGYEGGIVVSNAVFHLPRRVDYTWLPWCTYTRPELASIGMNEKAAQEAGIDATAWTEFFISNDRALAEGGAEGKIKMILDDREKPIGVQILGPSAGELLAEWVAVLGGKVKLSTLAAAVHPYPTLAEINKRVAGDLLATKIFSDKVKKGLKLFFNLRGRACRTPER
ncbi:MAG: FAD-dependent oxidoreductase [Proteobacteria bacterium]|nr:FAD-dependent oxidoreductase [Pseudomonadota bacterium]